MQNRKLLLVVFSGLYNSFRTTREATKQFGYHKLESDDQGRGGKLRPPRPPQPKSVSVPETGDAMEGLLIDLSDVSLKAPSADANKPKEQDVVSLLDSSIADKYCHLPAPLGDKIDDPFEVNLNIKSWTPPPDMSRSIPQAAATPRVGTSLSPRHTAATSSPNLSMRAPSTIRATTEISFTTAPTLRSDVSLQGSAFSSVKPCQRDPAVEKSPSHSASQAERTISPLPPHGAIGGAESSPGPPLPPRIYANLPLEATETTQPPPLPDKSKAMKLPNASRYYSLPPKDSAPSSIPPEMTSGLSVGNSRFYDAVPDESPKHESKGHVNIIAMNYVTEDPSKVNKAFDWLNDSVSQKICMEKDKFEDKVNEHTSISSKPALDTWEAKNLVVQMDVKPKTYSKVGNTTKRWGSQTLSSSGALSPTSTQDTYSDWGDDFDDFEEESNDPPALPPRDFVSKSQQPKQQKPQQQQQQQQHQAPQQPTQHQSPPNEPPRDGVYRNLPRILPVFKNGKRVSTDHYFVIPSWSGATPPPPQTAEVKPFVRGRQVTDNGARGGGEPSPYMNINHMNPCLDQALNHPPHRRRPADTATNSSGGDTWSHLTGLKPISPETEQQPLHNLQAGVSTKTAIAMASVADPYPGDPQQKVYAVQKEVHGVTQDESQTALANNNWSVSSAVKYLKVEQLFRLGIAPRERCQKLLETFQWNLEMAGSVLLDELSMGSPV